MRLGKRLVSSCLALGCFVAAPNLAQAAWPERPVTIVVPNNPGSGVDLGARILAEAWSKSLGQPFVVENVPGAANTVGAAKVADSPADGYTLLHCSLSSIVLVPLMRSDLTYAAKDLTPVARTMSASNIVVVNPQKLPVDDFAGLIEELKAKPGKYNYSSSGVGGLSHLLHELMMLKTGTTIEHIPYTGSSEATAALLAGEVDLAIVSTTPVLPYVESGQLRALAVAQPNRIAELPDVPTIGEIVPDYEGVDNWNAVFVPAETPQEIIDRLSAATTDYLATREAQDAMVKVGAVASPLGAADFQAQVESDIAVWSDVIDSAGLAAK